MHLRKQKMFELSDAFAVLPGGIGTLDETFEVLTWRQLGLHGKPIVLLSAADYWRPFKELVDEIVKAEFAMAAVGDLFSVVASPKELFELLDHRRIEATLGRHTRHNAHSTDGHVGILVGQ